MKNNEEYDLVNEVLLNKLKMRDYDEVCPNCKGWDSFGSTRYRELCPICKGRGKVDWIDRIKIPINIKKIK